MVVDEGSGYRTVSCQICPATTYSLGTESYTCTQCPEGADCPGGDKVIAQEEYWNGGASVASVYECPYGEDSCLGGVNSTCGDGFEQGYRVCGKCLDSHARVGDECVECNFEGMLSVLPKLGAIIVLILIALVVVYYVKKVLVF
jgi:hypothetical protein